LVRDELEALCLDAVSASMKETITRLAAAGFSARQIYRLYLLSTRRRGEQGQPTYLTGIALELVRRGLWTREEAGL